MAALIHCMQFTNKKVSYMQPPLTNNATQFFSVERTSTSIIPGSSHTSKNISCFAVALLGIAEP